MTYFMVSKISRPSPYSKSLYNVESRMLLCLFSILEKKLFFVPVFSANYSCVMDASRLSSLIISPIANAFAFISNSVRFDVPIFPYCLSKAAIVFFATLKS